MTLDDNYSALCGTSFYETSFKRFASTGKKHFFLIFRRTKISFLNRKSGKLLIPFSGEKFSRSSAQWAAHQRLNFVSCLGDDEREITERECVCVCVCLCVCKREKERES